jgi:two-component system sensor histidine kinase KdpD
MGGSLAAEDTPGGGLTMVVSLPAAAASTPRPGSDARRIAGNSDAGRPRTPAAGTFSEFRDAPGPAPKAASGAAPKAASGKVDS